MGLPAIAIPYVINITACAITAFEVYRAASNTYGEYKNYQDDLKKAKEEVKKIIKNLEDEISDKIDNKSEVIVLTGLADADKQSEKTKQATGRGTKTRKNSIITGAIRQKIPFRNIISQVCDKAEKMPMIQLRDKKGKSLNNIIPKSKVDIVAKLLAMTAEEFGSAKVDDYIIVRLKQLAANFMFEFIDQILEWKSSIKAEVCFGFDAKSGKYLAPKLVGQTQLQRDGPDLNPFWPLPYKGKGVIGADLIIPEYRGEPLTLTNIFALVEIKFKGDRINDKQFRDYDDLRKQCAKEKKHSDVTVSEGFKLSLFRYPEDASPNKDEDVSQTRNKDKKIPSKRGSR